LVIPWEYAPVVSSQETFWTQISADCEQSVAVGLLRIGEIGLRAGHDQPRAASDAHDSTNPSPGVYRRPPQKPTSGVFFVGVTELHSLGVTIRWGIVGCGQVCEVKSGPALYKVTGSEVSIVMRRDRARAEDYARRHGIRRFTDDAHEVIVDPNVDAVYMATPPGTHEH